jgi:NAD(P)-dependent dehydrogenase (short-subunit alcohol dehydrogenase family)
VAVDKDAERGAGAVNEAVASGGHVVFVEGDVADESTIVRAIDLCSAEFGGLSIMHNNAARQVEAVLHEAENRDIDEMLAVNLKATICGCKHAVRRMLRDRPGKHRQHLVACRNHG